ncbi:MAG: hypothetical protein ACTSPD_07670 [Promethearchaeota archaeon]
MSIKVQEIHKVLARIQAMYESIENLEYIFIIHKKSGICIYFKSYIKTKVKTKELSGFLTQVLTFGKNIDSQDIINEIKFNQKIILIADGKFIRIGLLTSKKPSVFFYPSYRKLIDFLEKKYFFSNELKEWNGHLESFKDIEKDIDIIIIPTIKLAHKIRYDLSNIDALIDAHSIEVFNLVNNLITRSGRNFFFINDLIEKIQEEKEEDLLEIFESIKKLKKNGIFTPIDVNAFKRTMIPQKEVEFVKNVISELTNFSQNEKQRLVQYLIQLNIEQRDVYLFTLMRNESTISPKISTKLQELTIDDLKTAKKELNKIKKIVKGLRKEKDYLNAIYFAENGVKVALEWNLNQEVEELLELYRISKIADLNHKLKNLSNLAEKAIDDTRYSQAIQNYIMASQLALDIFRLGVFEISNKVKEYANIFVQFQKLKVKD